MGLVLDASSGHGSRSTTPTSTSPSTQTLSTTSLSASIDLSAYDPPVGDQGAVNSCVAWATGYTLLGWFANRNGLAGLPYAPMFVYSSLTGGQNTGTGFDASMSFEAQHGIDTQADYWQGTTDYTDLPTAAEQANAANYKSTGYTALYSSFIGTGNPQTIIESTLAAGYPVAVGIPVYGNLTNANPAAYYVDVPPPGSTLYGYHAVVGVKYDANGLWIENSWGTGWGLNGYAELSWAFVNQYMMYVYKQNGFIAPALGGSTPTPTATAAPSGGTSTPAGPTSTATNTTVPPTPTRVAFAISLQPNAGKAGSSTSVSGQGFAAGETVTVTWSTGTKTMFTGVVASAGTFTGTIAVPKNARTGTDTIIAKGSTGDSAGALFTVQ
jgi:hypothetical protein